MYEIRDGGVVVIFIERKDGCVIETLISTDDFDRVNEFKGKWHASLDKRNNSYYISGHQPKEKGGYEKIKIHRWITRCPKGLEVDHINHNTLDNTRENLRISTHMENMQNLRLSITNKSGHRGVSRRKNGKWVARVGLRGKRIHIGEFCDLNTAAEAAHQARIELMNGYPY